MQNEIINYSAEAREEGLILHTSVTIGYDVPWRQVQELLINAALISTNILKNPRPYVLKINLDDHYVTYELNAYTAEPSEMDNIYSDLHQNILDNFNEASVEIMSPTYFAFRDGQNSTIPEVIGNSNGKSKPLGKNGEKTSYSRYREKTQPLGSR
jgi:small-conductance mechanosensitive channel